jgi:hypothetical protein
MNVRPINKSKKSNIKCEHCKYYFHDKELPYENEFCIINNEGSTRYYKRCKLFVWNETKKYLEGSSKC